MTEDLAAQQEKNSAAVTSVAAAVVLTIFKIVVGVATGSLGILAEAAHSGLDLVAALMTWFAVYFSGKPADRSHPYGHGKIENLSALFETLLLLLTCGWIVYGAIERLLYSVVEIEVNVWSFLVMFTSIGIDYSRAKVLRRAAQKHNSQALEADALHFETDIWSSAVVILGLICVAVGEWQPQWSELVHADAIAALLVALIVVYVSVRLGLRTVHALLDAAPPGMAERIIETVDAIDGVSDCHQVRIRYSGAQPFVDIHVLVDGGKSLREAHELTEKIEEVIQQLLPRADVTVHPEPLPDGR